MRTRIRQACSQFKPDIVHVHNFFPRITPSVYDAARESGAAVVQTLHNYRLVCLSGNLFRDGRACEDCTGKRVPWPGVIHGCYRGSRAGSAAVAAMLTVNRVRYAWTHRVDRFIALTSFARDFFLKNTSIAPDKICLKPNATADPGVGSGTGGYALYAGRLSPDKGLPVLIEAAQLGLGMPLKVAGSGPLEGEVKRAADAGLLAYLGPQSSEQMRLIMQEASVLVLPSVWYEGLPMVVAEAYGTGLPVVASRIGSLASLIVDGETGLHAEAHSAFSFAAAVRRIAATPTLLSRLRAGARREYEERYRPEMNVRLLKKIYDEAWEHAGKGHAGTA